MINSDTNSKTGVRIEKEKRRREEKIKVILEINPKATQRSKEKLH